MRIRRKLFTDQAPEQMTSRDMQLEQMKLQRQLMQTSRLRQKLEAQERRDESRRIMQLQKMEHLKDIEEDRQRVRVKKLEDKDDNVNTSLYKSKSHPVAPVSMK